MDVHGPNAVCRVCGMPPESGIVYIPLFEAIAPNKSCSQDILEIIEILKLNVKPKDGLPQKICFSCLKTLAVISEFRKRCEDVQKILAFYHISLTSTNIQNETKIQNAPGSKSEQISIDISEEQAASPANLTIPDVKSEPSDEDSEIQSNETLAVHISNGREVIRRPKRKTALACLMKFKNDDFESNISFAEDDGDDYTPDVENDGSNEFDMQVSNSKENEVKHKVNGIDFENEYVLIEDDLQLETENGDIYLLNEALNEDENSLDEYDSINFSTDEDMDDLDLSMEYYLNSRDTIDPGENQTIEIINQNDKNFVEEKNAEVEDKMTKRKSINIPQKDKERCPFCHKLFGSITLHKLNCRLRKGLACKYCYTSLETAEELKQHIETMHPEGLPACHICFSTFESVHKRREHIREQHTEIRFECIPCNRQFKAKSILNEHNARMHTKPVNKECPICHKICKSMFIYNKHQRQHKNAENLKCRFCQKLFTRLLYKTNHERIHTGEKPYLCDVCGKSFITQFEVKLHLEKKHGNQTEQTKKPTVPPKKKPRLQKHTDEGKYVCQQCGRRYKQQAVLDRHTRRYHLKSTNSICTVCGKICRGNFELKCHMFVHKDERPLKCDYCPMLFERKKQLKLHLAIHWGREHICQLCGKAYKYSANLKTHMRTHAEGKQKLSKNKQES